MPSTEGGTGGTFKVTGQNTFGQGSAISTAAPSLKAGIGGVVMIENQVYAEACFGGCADATFDLNFTPGAFDILRIDTSKTVPLSAFGLDIDKLSYGQKMSIGGLGEHSAEMGSIELRGLVGLSGNLWYKNTITAHNRDTAVRFTANLTGMAQRALGLEVDVLNPSFGMGSFASLSGTLFGCRIVFEHGFFSGRLVRATSQHDVEI